MRPNFTPLPFADTSILFLPFTLTAFGVWRCVPTCSNFARNHLCPTSSLQTSGLWSVMSRKKRTSRSCVVAFPTKLLKIKPWSPHNGLCCLGRASGLELPWFRWFRVSQFVRNSQRLQCILAVFCETVIWLTSYLLPPFMFNPCVTQVFCETCFFVLGLRWRVCMIVVGLCLSWCWVSPGQPCTQKFVSCSTSLCVLNGQKEERENRNIVEIDALEDQVWDAEIFLTNLLFL